MEKLFKAYPKQAEFINAVMSHKYEFCLFGGGIRGGKTYVCIIALQLLALRYPKSRWYVIRKDMPTLTDTTIPTFRKLAITSQIKTHNNGDIIKDVKGKYLVEFNNGSQIIFAGENYNRDKELTWALGLECNGFFLEQIEELSFKMFQQALQRSGTWTIEDGTIPKRVIMATVNPTITWVKEKFYEPWAKGELNPNFYYLPALIKDNAAMFNNQDYMSGLDLLDDMTKRRMVDGDWDAFGVDKPFAYMFEESLHIQTLHYQPHLELFFCFDFGVSPLACVVAQVDEVKREVYILSEFHESNNNVIDLCTQIKAYTLSLPVPPMVMIVGDPSGVARSPLAQGASNAYQIIYNELDLHRDSIRTPAKFSIANSQILFNTILQHYTFKIDPKAKNTLKDIKYVEVMNKGGKIALKKTGTNTSGDNNANLTHYLDAVRYLVHYCFYDILQKF